MSKGTIFLPKVIIDYFLSKIHKTKKRELHGGRYRTCIEQSQWNVKYRSRAPGQGACLKSMSMTITMQGFTLAAINDAEKTKLRSNFEVKIFKVNGSQNIGEGHWVKVHA